MNMARVMVSLTPSIRTQAHLTARRPPQARLRVIPNWRVPACRSALALLIRGQ
jgi:hypothetical protein